jgi:hypothetical protein
LVVCLRPEVCTEHSTITDEGVRSSSIRLGLVYVDCLKSRGDLHPEELIRNRFVEDHLSVFQCEVPGAFQLFDPHFLGIEDAALPLKIGITDTDLPFRIRELSRQAAFRIEFQNLQLLSISVQRA